MDVKVMKENKIKILLHGYININVMDGSAVFITGFADMLSQSPNLEIDFVIANPIYRDILIQPLFEKENVNIISPYSDKNILMLKPDLKNRNRMTHREAADVLSYYWTQKEYDWLIIRGMEVVEHLAETNPQILKNTMTYVTGITHEGQIFTKEKEEKIEKVFKNSAYLLCQTIEMKQYLLHRFPDFLKNTEIIHLNPMIPDTVDDFIEVFEEKEKYTKLCYTGKFDVGWNSIPMITAFRELLDEYPEISLAVAGDRFNINKQYPHYVEELKYLLQNTKNLDWYGALPRNEVRSLIMASDIGITWRDKRMDSSLELSTKLLEYGSLGKAVVMNPTKMHIKLFGEDYPLYAETMDDFIQCVSKVIEDPKLYRQAAERMFEVSKKFTYSETLKRFLPYLINGRYERFFQENHLKIPENLEEQLKATADFPYIYENLDDSKSVLIINYINKIANVKEHILLCSKYGVLSKNQKVGNIVLTLVNRTDNDEHANLVENLGNSIFDDLLSNITVQKNSQFNVQQLKTHGHLLYSDESNSDSLSIKHNLKNRIKELEIIEKKYKALASSKLGKLTIKYWNFKKKFR